MKKILAYILIFSAIMFSACEPDYKTLNVSEVSVLPKFEYEGGQFISFVKGSRATFNDPGARAFVNDEELRVVSFKPDTFYTDQANVYIVFYFAQNNEGIIAEGRRIVAITHEPVGNNDLEGTYITSNSYGWPAVESKVRKKNDQGWYSCTEVLGFPDVETKGEFVDIGEGELVILPGESFFGDYDVFEGNYTLTSLSWSVYLIDEPYSGIEIPVVLIKKDE